MISIIFAALVVLPRGDGSPALSLKGRVSLQGDFIGMDAKSFILLQTSRRLHVRVLTSACLSDFVKQRRREVSLGSPGSCIEMVSTSPVFGKPLIAFFREDLPKHPGRSILVNVEIPFASIDLFRNAVSPRAILSASSKKAGNGVLWWCGMAYSSVDPVRDAQSPEYLYFGSGEGVLANPRLESAKHSALINALASHGLKAQP